MTKKATSKSYTLVKLFPNMVTLAGLCVGLSAIRFALNDQWEWAVGFIIIASVIDAVDGKVARMLDATSEFGAQLDSLSDFLNFGIAPPFILYLWVTQEVKGLGWALVLYGAVCCAVRLARFNTDLDTGEERPAWKDRFFTGIPAPAGAMLMVGPMITVFAFKEDFPTIFHWISFFENPIFASIYGAVIATLMASRLPTFSFKKLSVPREYLSLVMIAGGLFIIAAIIEPWPTMFAVGIWYYSTLPLSVISYLRYSK